MPDVDLFADDSAASYDFGFFDVTTQDYAHFLEQLSPHGNAWKVRPDGVLDRLRQSLGLEFSRVTRRSGDLLAELDPRTSEEMLGDWETDLGLPAICLGGDPPTTVAGRQSAAFVKLTTVAAGNEPFFLASAAALGFPGAEIVRYGDPFTCISDCTDALYGFEGGWLDHWDLVAHDVTGETGATLACLARDYAQAQETVRTIFE